ncbi:pirin family protein [Nocardioides currus]|uniref:Quercetin 2,3-dioxygenase n=1 Tax=Nocardioides currus TaxID=2133958 RepID=A0A2R7YY72_9ACTN|nr:pirin family protein [Nocardioides currus]PUA81291.1 quercetin 2,3-dioxygenase [Nocardioides currus]
MGIVVYAGSERFSTSLDDRLTRHSFSFGPHYDPANLGFGPMICHNDDLLRPGGGYPDHPHADLEIVTWVLDGVLLHTDSTGHTEELRPGDVQVMSAGSGIRHAEVADAGSGPTRFLQTWITPDEGGTPPRWRSEHVDPGPGLTQVVGGQGLPIGTRGAELAVARLAPGEAVDLPDAGLAHAFVALGSGFVPGRDVTVGDAVRLVDEPGARFTATDHTELVVWSFSR